MFDDQHAEILEFLADHPTSSLICPDYMLDRLHQLLPGSVAYPYCAATAPGGAEAETVIVHKGMVRALGWRRLAATLTAATAVMANDVFVIFRRGAVQSPPDGGINAHLAPLLAFCRQWQSVSDTAAPGGRAVIASAWNLGNCGDDAVSLAAAAMCRRLGFKEVTLLGPSGPLERIEGAGLVLLGGGGTLYDSDIQNVANYTAPLRFAAACGVPFAALGVGTQGIRSPFGRAAYHEALAGAAVITARDGTDVSVLRDACDLPSTEAGADLAFALPELEPHWFAPVPRPSRARPLALLSIGYTRETPGLQGETLLRSILGLARSIGQTHELLLARHSTDDAAVHAEAARILGIRDLDLAALGVPMAITAYAQADLVVTSRYHGAIFAALTGVPVAVVCNATAKLGRLVNQALPSLSPAMTPLDESGSPLLDGQELARQARPAAPAEVAAQRNAALAGEARLASALQTPRALGIAPARATPTPAIRPPVTVPVSSIPAATPTPPAPPQPWHPALIEACAQASAAGGMMLTIGAPLPPALPPLALRRIARQGAAQADRTEVTLALAGDTTHSVPLDPAGPWPGNIAKALADHGKGPVAVLRLAGTEIDLAHRAMSLFDPAVMVLERPSAPPASDAFDALLVAMALTGRQALTWRDAKLVPVPLFETEPALRQRIILCTEAARAAFQPQAADTAS